MASERRQHLESLLASLDAKQSAPTAVASGSLRALLSDCWQLIEGRRCTFTIRYVLCATLKTLATPWRRSSIRLRLPILKTCV